MKVLIAEDDPIPRRMLQAALLGWGYEVVVACDGQDAWEALQGPSAPRLAVLDWEMPVLDGVTVCRRLRSRPTPEPTYVILLTARDAQADIVAGLQSGANDYVVKPFDRDELQARVRVGQQVVELQRSLALRVRELEEAMSQLKQLQGLLPICSYCKKIRDDRNYWQQVETYVSARAAVRFSHGICPDCWEREVGPQLERAGIPPPPPQSE
jgi:DNA-binding response OmpR family regulator